MNWRKTFTIMILLIPSCFEPAQPTIRAFRQDFIKPERDTLRDSVLAGACMLVAARQHLLTAPKQELPLPSTCYYIEPATARELRRQFTSRSELGIDMLELMSESRGRLTSEFTSVQLYEQCELDDVCSEILESLDDDPRPLPADYEQIMAIYFSDQSNRNPNLRRVLFAARPHPSRDHTVVVECLESSP